MRSMVMAAAMAAALTAQGADKVKIGFISTLSGPNASIGTDIGISTNGQSNVGIRGPGIVQRFSGDGILFMASTRGWVQGVTATTNCMSGIRINPASSQISVESNVSVRNGAAAAACGGI